MVINVPWVPGSVSTDEKAQIIQNRLSTGATPCRLQAMCRSGLPFRRRITWMFPGVGGVFRSGFFVSRSAVLISRRNRVSISFRFASSIKILLFLWRFHMNRFYLVSMRRRQPSSSEQASWTVKIVTPHCSIQVDDAWDNISSAK